MQSKFLATAVVTVLLMLGGGQLQAQTEGAHVSDNLTVFIHTGPSRNYRIIGSIQAGTAIEITDRQGEPEFVQMTDPEGREGWIEAQYISTTGTLREQVPALQQQVTELTQQLSALQESHQRLRNDNTTLTQQNQRLATELEESVLLASDLQQRVDEADQSAMMEWFTRGGIVAAVSILLGILITYLPKKRRRNDQWM
ncbi:TIGR04211 family SH3 domain-containing protein [Alteromonas sp. ASW11-36]|uniref:TIGR04211 family SH3 domain-containing protein n=1 Tax=Alteromonas arenosi TaxID=3055817 RepID=A0ABT7SZP4_9ALTE|nr:TIGR04211 family SH3 domain-containing protein [Alteromonas sp. ASW11-36]MDM7861671.1 TIGR04211 family SH3 domain-containing protein [Alteromonas sp. ASW11-36]